MKKLLVLILILGLSMMALAGTTANQWSKPALPQQESVSQWGG
jgi:hypothetical protein